MKILVLSDIHSNIIALEAIWAKEKDSDFTICAGDIVDYGPYPKEVIAWIQAHNVPTVQGNHELWVCMNYHQGDALPNPQNEERGWVTFTAQQLDEADIHFLEQLPESLTFEFDDIQYGMTHLVKGLDEIVSRHGFQAFRHERFKDTPYERLIVGHTHRQGIRYLDNEHLWLNPGSVSYRRKDDPDQTAHYATIINGRISLNTIAYNRVPLFQAAQKIPLGPFERARTNQMFG